MSEELTRLADIIPKKHRVVCMTTNSLRTVLDLFARNDEEFPYGITKLEAWASNMEEKKPDIEDADYGIRAHRDRRLDSFSLRYELKWDENGRARNPIDELGKRTIENTMDRVGVEDASVSYLKVLIRDPKIGEFAGISEDLFHATLMSDPVDGEKDKEKVKEHPVNEALIKYNNFQYRILNCRRLIDRRQELTQPKSRYNYVVKWDGKTAISLRSPIKVAQRLKERFGEYGLIKQYGVGEEFNLVLLSVSR